MAKRHIYRCDDHKYVKKFHNTSLTEAGLSDCHRVIVSAFRAFLKRLPAKVIEYQNYKTFDQNEFLRNSLQR